MMKTRIIELYKTGKTVAEISRICSISPSTVRHHLSLRTATCRPGRECFECPFPDCVNQTAPIQPEETAMYRCGRPVADQ